MIFKYLKIRRCKKCKYHSFELGKDYCAFHPYFNKHNIKYKTANIPLICLDKQPLYRCDPDKNFNCYGTSCYRKNNGDFCRHCWDEKYKMSLFKRIKELFIWKVW